MSIRSTDLPARIRLRIAATKKAGRIFLGDYADAPPAKPAHVPGQMNKGERLYRDYLDRLILAGEIRAYKFESIKLRLAERFHYTPDFVVVLTDGTIEFREVKGAKGDTYYAKEDAVKSIKAAAALYPWWRFVITWPGEGGCWKQKEIRA